jgi:hypothetical protein
LIEHTQEARESDLDMLLPFGIQIINYENVLPVLKHYQPSIIIQVIQAQWAWASGIWFIAKTKDPYRILCSILILP